MKKTILSILAMFGFATFASAQLSSGTFFAGGSLGFNSTTNSTKVGGTTNDNWKSSSFFIRPSAGYFVADNTAVGLAVGFNSTKYIDYDTNGDKITTTGAPIDLSIFARRFFMLNENFGFFAGLNVGTRFGKDKTEMFDFATKNTTVVENKLSGFNASLNAGTVWFPAEHIGIEASVGVLGYSTLKSTRENSNPESSTTEKGFDFGVNSMNLNFGFHYYFFK